LVESKESDQEEKDQLDIAPTYFKEDKSEENMKLNFLRILSIIVLIGYGNCQPPAGAPGLNFIHFNTVRKAIRKFGAC